MYLHVCNKISKLHENWSSTSSHMTYNGKQFFKEHIKHFFTLIYIAIFLLYMHVHTNSILLYKLKTRKMYARLGGFFFFNESNLQFLVSTSQTYLTI